MRHHPARPARRRRSGGCRRCLGSGHRRHGRPPTKAAIDTLEDAIRRIDRETRELLRETFDSLDIRHLERLKED